MKILDRFLILMKTLTRYISLFFLASATVYAVCAQDNYSTIATEMPETWEYTSNFSQDFPSDDPWWKIFNDPLLDSLIYEGEQNNYNLKQAARRIEMARNSVTQARSAYYPGLSVSAGWSHERESGKIKPGSGSAVTTGYFSGMVDMNWEVGIFGKIQEQVKESQANVSASRADYASVSVSLAAEIASAYMSLRTLQEEMRVTEEHIKAEETVMDITQTRFEVGLVSMLDVSQAKTVYLTMVASLSSLRTQIETTINSIAILTGTFPQDMRKRLSAYKAPPKPDFVVKVGIPLSLLRRRPDIVEAEYELASYAAALGVAKKDFLPTISISGSIGTQATNFSDLMSKNSFVYSIAPTISWTFFDGYSRKAAEASAREQLMAGIDNYNQTVLTAVQEVDNAMITYTEALKYEHQIEEVVKSARQSYDLALDRYRQGLDDFINVADAQLTLLQYANELVEARGDALTAIINLYKALGGGWDISQMKKD